MFPVQNVVVQNHTELWSVIVWVKYTVGWLIVLGFKDTSTIEGYFVLSSREREERDSRRDEREGGKKEEQKWK